MGSGRCCPERQGQGVSTQGQGISTQLQPGRGASCEQSRRLGDPVPLFPAQVPVQVAPQARVGLPSCTRTRTESTEQLYHAAQGSHFCSWHPGLRLQEVGVTGPALRDNHWKSPLSQKSLGPQQAPAASQTDLLPLGVLQAGPELVILPPQALRVRGLWHVTLGPPPTLTTIEQSMKKGTKKEAGQWSTPKPNSMPQRAPQWPHVQFFTVRSRPRHKLTHH